MLNGEIRLMVTIDMTIEEWNFIRINLFYGMNIHADCKFITTEIWRVIKIWALWIKKILMKKVRIRLVLCD